MLEISAGRVAGPRLARVTVEVSLTEKDGKKVVKPSRVEVKK